MKNVLLIFCGTLLMSFLLTSCGGTPCKVCDAKGYLKSGIKCDFCRGDGKMSKEDKKRASGH